MHLDNENKTNNNTDTSEPTKQKTRTICSKKEITATVRQFVFAWIRGEVRINFPTASSIRERDFLDGRFLVNAEAMKKEDALKNFFIDKVSIVTGKTPSTAAEQEKTILELFDLLLASRAGYRIEGTFGKKDEQEARIAALEEQVNAMNVVMEELVIAYRSGLGKK